MARSKLLTVYAAAITAVLAWDPADAPAQWGGGGGNVPGKRWEYTVRKGGRQIEEGTFRSHDFKLYKGAMQTDTFTQTGMGALDLDITKGELKGKIDMSLIRKELRPVYAREWEMAGGGRARIQIKFLED